MASTSEAALKLEIARLTGAINRHKSSEASSKPKSQSTAPVPRHWNNAYTHPSSNKYVRPGLVPSTSVVPARVTPPVRPPSEPSQTRDVVIDGVAFETSGRSLVRKGLPKPAAPPPRPRHVPTKQHPSKEDYSRTKTGHFIKSTHVYKAKPPSRTRNRNMTLNNTRRPYQARRVSAKKFVDKPCPRFTTTGSCNRGLTCPYQHDPSKIAICWPFLQGSCPHGADACALSHDPTPQRTPLCVHFANNGRCTRDSCPFPHVRVGLRQGVCRDFAVLGYCDKGLECDRQHIRECPDFAERGTCETKGCKLPHVIRANRNRQAANGKKPATDSAETPALSESATPLASSRSSASAEDAKIGDEYISLTFNESESDEESDEEEDEEEDDEEDDDGEEEEGEDPIEAGAEDLVVY